jgi:hypothetical protein
VLPFARGLVRLAGFRRLPRVSKRLSGPARRSIAPPCACDRPVDPCPGPRVQWNNRETDSRAYEGTGALGTAATIASFFGTPVVAAIVGAALGVAMLSLTRAGVGFVTPEAPELGAVRAVIMLTAGLVAALVGLFVYFAFMRAGLTAFGLGMALGFVVPATVALFRMSGMRHASVKGR